MWLKLLIHYRQRHHAQKQFAGLCIPQDPGGRPHCTEVRYLLNHPVPICPPPVLSTQPDPLSSEPFLFNSLSFWSEREYSSPESQLHASLSQGPPSPEPEPEPAHCHHPSFCRCHAELLTPLPIFQLPHFCGHFLMCSSLFSCSLFSVIHYYFNGSTGEKDITEFLIPHFEKRQGFCFFSNGID